MSVYIEEFLYRGRDDADQPPAWHLILASVETNALGQTVKHSQIMSVAQAEAAGWSLPKVIAVINHDLLKEVEAVRAKVVDLEAAASARDEENARLQSEVQKLDEALTALDGRARKRGILEQSGKM